MKPGRPYGVPVGAIRCALVLLAAAACMDAPTAPGRGAGVSLVVEPVFPAEAALAGFSLEIDNVRLIVRAVPSLNTLRDTVVQYHPDSAAVTVQARELEIRSAAETVAVTLALRAGPEDLFSGTRTVELLRGAPGTTTVVTIALSYIGPGANIAELSVAPRDTVLTFADSLRLTVAARDSAGNPVTRFYVAWSVSDSSLGFPNAFGIVRAPSRRGVLAVRTITPNGTRDSTPLTFIPVPTGLQLVVGDSVVAPVGSDVPVAVRVVAGDGLGVRGIPVRIGVEGGAGAVRDTLLVSDVDGIVATTAALGERVGTYRFVASIAGAPPAVLTATATAGSGADQLVVSGDGQAGEVGAVLPERLAVRVVDRFGNPVPGHRVRFAGLSEGSSVSDSLATTDTVGEASTEATLGVYAGPQTFEASAEGLATRHFGVTALPGPTAAMRVHTGDDQVGVVGTRLLDPLVVQVLDRFGNPVPEQVVNFVVTAGRGALFTGNGFALTDAEGFAADFWTLGSSTADSQRVEARAVRSLGGGAFEPIVIRVFSATALPGPVARIELAPSELAFAALGARTALTARALDVYGNPVPESAVAWTSSNEAVVTVDATGLATAVGNGTATIAATAAALSSGATVTVRQVSTALDVTPTQATLVGLGASIRLMATALDANGYSVTDAVIEWRSSAPTVATVDDTGLVTAVGPGTASIAASVGGLGFEQVTLTVAAIVTVVPAVHLAVAPERLVLTALGATGRLTAVVTGEAGSPVPGAPVTWRSSDLDVATVDGDGVVTARSNGTTVITAASGDVTGSATVTVAQTVAAVLVTPETVTLRELGATTQLVADVRDANGQPVTNAGVGWASSAEAVATVDAVGLVTAVGNGTATVTATAGGVSGAANVLVVSPVLTVLIDVKPGSDPNSINLGADGSVPVAVLTSRTATGDPVSFDAATVAPSSVRFAGAPPLRWAHHDVDGDGDLDLVLHFAVEDLQLTAASTTAELTGRTTSGAEIRGASPVRIVPRSS